VLMPHIRRGSLCGIINTVLFWEAKVFRLLFAPSIRPKLMPAQKAVWRNGRPLWVQQGILPSKSVIHHK
jgi:hypothetical protein